MMTTKIEHQIFSYETLSILEIGNTGDGTTRTLRVPIREVLMKSHLQVARSAVIAFTLFGAGLLLDVSLPTGTQSLSVGVSQAEARVGRPGTATSVAGVARRSTRRAVRRHY